MVMDYAAAAEAMMRRRMLEGIYDRMTPEERRLFVQMTLQERSSGEILRALRRQSAQIRDVGRRQQTFGRDFLSNIAGNAAWSGAAWLLARLARLAR